MTDDPSKTKLINIDLNDWKRKLGTDTLIRIIRIMVGLNRLYALWNLMTQTAISDEEMNKARSFRNRSVSYVLTNGILHEIYPILQRLAGDMKTRCVTVFEKIKEILLVFDQNPLRNILTEFRDFVSFHISEDIVRAGLNATKDSMVTFIKYDSDTYRDTYYKFAEDVSIYGFFNLFRAKFDGVESENFDEFYKEQFAQFTLYNLEIQTTFAKKFDDLLVDLVDKFKLTTQTDDRNSEE